MSAYTREVRTQCPYCGVGCGLVASVEAGRVTAVAGDPLHPVNRGATCRKPLRLPDAVHAEDRATVPMMRSGGDARWEPARWKTIIPQLASRLQRIIDEHGPEAIAFYISGQLLTEDYYVISKLAKGFLGTNNVDSNSRLCMSSAVAGYVGSLGSDGPPSSYADLAQADCILVLGSNTAACHPIVWSKIRARQAEGAKLIVVDPRRTPTAEAADLHLAVRPGADLPLLAAMLGVLDGEGLTDPPFIARHTEGFEAALDVAADWPAARAAEATGIPADDIVTAARMFGTAGRAMALWSMGANQSTVGTLKNQALTNLCLATGNIGRPGTGPFSLTGQPNAMGGRESGGLSTLLPGYRKVEDPEHRAQMRTLWDIPADQPGISPAPGIPATELVEALEDGTVKAVWIVATNPVVSQPDAQRFTAALRRADLVVVQDAYHPTETSSVAHVVLPAAQWPEKEGTMTNSERRVGLVRKAVDPPGEALPDWEIFARLGRAMGHKAAFGWRTAAEVFAEYVRTTEGRLCDQTGLSHERLRREGALQWPIPARGVDGEDHGGTERLYTSRRFPTPNGRARFTPTPHREPADTPDEDFPLVLTTGRVAHQWHTMTRTGKAKDLVAAEPEPFVELHPEDAAAAGVADGERVRIRSRRGRAMLRARVTDGIPRGVAFAPFHWGALHLDPGAGALNAVSARAIDPTSKQAELKATAICVEPVRTAERADGTAGMPRVARGEGAGRAPRRRLVVIGTGMSGMSTVEAALAHGGAEAWDVTMVGREPGLPYNRVMLSKLLAGAMGEGELHLRQVPWFADRGITLRSGASVRAIDVAAREVELADGERLPYDRLVVATGSQPAVPPIPGIDLDGVLAFRTMEDCRAILAAAAEGDGPASRAAVVIGGGLLGLEAARGLRERGLRVTVVHLADRLMEQQLDPLSAQMLARSLAGLGVGLRLAATTSAIAAGDDGRVRRVVLADGEELDADLVVVATGVRPDVQLARDAGLEVDRGIVVDDELRTSAPGVYAVGECVQHRSVVYGLWAPLLQQAKVAGASLCGEPAAFRGAVPATTLKVAGIDLFSGGRSQRAADDEELLALDSRQGIYRRLVLDSGRLVGAILLGDLREARPLRELLASGDPVPETLLCPGPAAVDPGAASVPADPTTTVCSCMNVERGEITRAIRDRALTSVEQVAEHTRASTGCGGCRADVAAILLAEKARGSEPLAAGRVG
ncbi:molybdopterin-dependent oxidoreductase [Paraconexibacter antarcticus]|uniref:Molybdopterin-dependent oxidoreductase n=1 Tax=Paraconexibacter antarcticus TaxID=2949664 RepID=A0ABY5DXC3_9ACTN|nr:molybdopterin-dependent oxidoreductase [Paraconexibacter antarcticus]UTI65295.1 molybdopterin-dependent oxidoreductase [Paraconexibacter antarcticus]